MYDINRRCTCTMRKLSIQYCWSLRDKSFQCYLHASNILHYVSQLKTIILNAPLFITFTGGHSNSNHNPNLDNTRKFFASQRLSTRHVQRRHSRRHRHDQHVRRQLRRTFLFSGCLRQQRHCCGCNGLNFRLIDDLRKRASVEIGAKMYRGHRSSSC